MSEASEPLGAEPGAASDRRARLAVVGCALALTLLGALKPLVVDDAAFHQYARHIAEDPLDPYGFDVFWYDWPEPAQEVLAPPVLAYWWSLAIRAFGDHPVAWKLWLLPFALLLCGSLDRVLRRVAPRLRVPLLCLIVLSPAVLPALNLMLDLPALALALASVSLVLAGCDASPRRGAALAAAAGLVGGVALQAKYTALLPQVAVLGYAALRGRVGVAALAGGIAAALFLGWEATMWRLYGESHFLMGTRIARVLAQASAAQWAYSFVCLLGVSSAVVGVLAGAARGAGTRAVLAALAAVAAVFASVAWLPAGEIATFAPAYPSWEEPGAESFLFAALGVATLAAVGVLVRGELRRGVGPRAWRARPLDAFLLLWVVLEVAGYFVLSPYPAMRRVIGTFVALALLVGRVADREATGLRTAGAIATAGAAFGLFFAVTDVVEARARTAAARRAFAELDALAERYGEGRRWYVGHWGFQYYAERAGLEPAFPLASRPEPGDWIAVADGVVRQRILLPPEAVEEVHEVVATHPWPWSTMPALYGGYRPLRPQPDALLRVRLLRVTRPFLPGWDRRPKKPRRER